MKKLLSLALAFVLVLSCGVTAYAAEGDTFNAGLNIQQTEGKITVTISEDNDAVLAAQKPTLTIPCTFEDAYVMHEEEELEFTLDTDEGEISFVVAEGGVYEIIDGIPSYKVSFVTGAEGVTIEDQMVEKGSKVVKPASDPAREDYVFRGWYKEETYKNPWDFDTDTVTGKMSLYAKWAQIFTLTGTVSNAGTQLVEVTLVAADGTEYPATVTDHATDATQRSYTVDAPADRYNLVVTADNGTATTTVTVSVSLTRAGQSRNVTLPSSDKSSRVDNTEAGSYAAAVGNLNVIANSSTAAAGDTIVFYVNHMDAAEQNAAATQVNAIKALSGSRTMVFLDLTLKKETASGNSEDIGDDNDTLLEINIPLHTANKGNIAVYRYHDGKAESLPTGGSLLRERFAVNNDSVAIYAKKFSTYAIGYTADTVTPNITSVTVTPETATLEQGEEKTFAAAVVDTADLDKTVTWTLTGNTDSDTTLSADGKLIVGLKEAAKELTVKATSNADSSKSDTAKVTVQAVYEFKTDSNTNYIWTKNSTKNLRFKVNGDVDTFEDLEIYDKNGNPVNITYTKTGTSSSTTITLKASDLKNKNLSSGTYTILAVYEDGSAVGSFSVQKSATSAATGDTFNPTLWISVMGICAAAIAVLVILKKKNDKK